jgi:hypothetical protein
LERGAMTLTEIEAYDRGFLAGANLRVEELRAAEAEIAGRRRWSRGLRLALMASMIWGSITSLAALWLALRW